jgi:hypothetical protein
MAVGARQRGGDCGEARGVRSKNLWAVHCGAAGSSGGGSLPASAAAGEERVARRRRQRRCVEEHGWWVRVHRAHSGIGAWELLVVEAAVQRSEMAAAVRTLGGGGVGGRCKVIVMAAVGGRRGSSGSSCEAPAVAGVMVGAAPSNS